MCSARLAGEAQSLLAYGVRRERSSQAVITARLDELEEQIEYLKIAYERYFNGVDNVPPTRKREVIDRAIRSLMREHMPTTALRFRFNSLRQRLTTYSHYWNRILNQIEKGTFKRLLAESKRRQREAEARARAARDKLRAAAEADGGGTAASSRARRGGPAKLPDGLDARQTRALFREYVTAKRAAGEKTDGLTYGAMVKKLATEFPKLQQRHGKDVRFEVTTVNGKVRLRARRS